MKVNHEYKTIDAQTNSLFRDRGSKFFGYAYHIASIEEGKAKLNDLKKEHPKATHHCFAWRIGQLGEQFRVSDDGEPSGSAGRPILGQIQSKELTNVLVVVVRYFGGSLLGVPGLINAYKTAASIALDEAPVIVRKIEFRFVAECDYTIMNEILHLIKSSQCTIYQQELLLFCSFEIGVPLENKESLLSKLKDIKGVTVKIPE